MVVIFFIIMLSMSFYVYTNKDKIFTSKVEIRYPDSCLEVYENTELITPVCETGRQILEAQQNGTYKPQGNNLQAQWNLSQIKLT